MLNWLSHEKHSDILASFRHRVWQGFSIKVCFCANTDQRPAVADDPPTVSGEEHRLLVPALHTEGKWLPPHRCLKSVITLSANEKGDKKKLPQLHEEMVWEMKERQPARPGETCATLSTCSSGTPETCAFCERLTEIEHS